MRLKRPSWLLLGLLLGLSGCSPTRLPAPDSPPPPGPIPTPPDAPAEPTFKPDVPPHVPPRFMRDDRPLPPLQAGNMLTLAARGIATRAGATGAGGETGLVGAINHLYGGREEGSIGETTSARERGVLPGAAGERQCDSAGAGVRTARGC